MSTATEQYVSIGRLADRFDVRRDDVRNAAERAGVAPAMVLDFVPYFHTADLEQIEGQLARKGEANDA